ncbi:hypothetical protein CHLRE_07g316050v5 [Chlamydomonas reinhardtii]|uniref:J domain-containing protein n=1 Tax=Chlamydomonas reinhardtii TaxID=3055 RepID=A0A2K3DIP9_CHLRE|nr:uncharacterized protein CHLRE_07g316050v5 [Chlamydomonas reinhardtii]PNW80400.1 hypothetical protein CHLRE_07g316050v5 [Chlamydomonas reinhardtii]
MHAALQIGGCSAAGFAPVRCGGRKASALATPVRGCQLGCGASAQSPMRAGAALGPRRSGRRTAVVCRAAAKNFYDILGVSASATDRDIKSAYRKLAMKLHPDVNKAPDAQKRFMEVKVAYETLSDAKQRAEYDRRLRGGYAGGRTGYSGSSSSSGYGGAYGGNSAGNWGSSYGTGGGNYGNYTQEPLPGLDDLIKELEKEYTAWVRERATKTGPGGRPKTLAEELEDLGGEFLDFLEEALGIKEEAGSSSSSSAGGNGSSSSTGAAAGAAFRETSKSAAEQFDAWWQQYGDGSPLGGAGGSSGAGASPAGSRSTSSGASASSSSSASSR